MRFTRRAFVRALGLTGAGLASSTIVGARGREASAAEAMRDGLLLPNDGSVTPALPELAEDNLLLLGSNENPRGPGKAALRALDEALAVSSRYPRDAMESLRRALAAELEVETRNILLGCGSTEILRIAVDAFCSPTKPLVTAAPTFEAPTNRAQALGWPVVAVPVTEKTLELDLARMVEASKGAGLVFLCNPNNPTGTLHSASAVADFIRRVNAASPETTILVDEAYHEYVESPAYATALPIALENPRVLVARTFSKAFGIAGLRVGYALGRPETLQPMVKHSLGIGVNTLGAAAARGALADRELVARERRLNHEARAFTADWFTRAGYAVTPSEANFVMVDIRRDARQFQDACRTERVVVGRPFPPLTTHTRVSIGTMDEMKAAVKTFGKVLGARA